MVSNRTILSQEQNRARLHTAALENAANLAVSQFFLTPRLSLDRCQEAPSEAGQPDRVTSAAPGNPTGISMPAGFFWGEHNSHRRLCSLSPGYATFAPQTV